MDHHLDRGDLQAGLALCNAWLAYRPGDSKVLLEKTDLALEAGEDAEAVDAYTHLARILRRSGRLGEAQLMLNRALILDSDHTGARDEATSLYQARHGKRIAETGAPSDLPEVEEEDEPLFSGETIAIIGGDKVGNYYIPAVQQLGAECTWISADTNPAYIRSKIQSMDGVCVVTSEISHALSGEAVRQAKLPLDSAAPDTGCTASGGGDCRGAGAEGGGMRREGCLSWTPIELRPNAPDSLSHGCRALNGSWQLLRFLIGSGQCFF